MEDDSLVYLGTLENSLYLYVRDSLSLKRVKRFEVSPRDKGKLQNEAINDLMKDSKGRIWIATSGGLHFLNQQKEIVHSVEFLTGEASLTCSYVNFVYEDGKGRFLVGTSCGLNVLREVDEGKFEVRKYRISEGLPENHIYSVEEDTNNFLWFNTKNSITKFNIDSGTFVNFYNSDGIEMLPLGTVSVKRKNGKISFFSSQGFINVDPARLKKAFRPNRLKIESLNILNEEVSPGEKYSGRVVLAKSVNDIGHFKLSHKENEFSFMLTYLNFSPRRRHHYSYKLENYNDSWVNIGERRHVSFNNLKSGEYVFRARALGEDGSWYELDRPIQISVLSPWWKRWYAMLLFFIISVGVLQLVRYNIKNQARLQQNIERLRVMSRREQEVNEIKYKFFTNISHELRTPLTLILGPLNEILKNKEKYGLSHQLDNKIQIIEKNAKRLLRLVNQLLDFRKFETGNQKILASRADIVELVKETVYTFSELARQNDISLTTQVTAKDTVIWYDPEKLEVILNNLISNSFKYILDNGEIKVIIDEDSEYLILRVVDNGKGIPEEDVSSIFNRFYQVEGSSRYGSSGIGLELVKQFVELHKGKIEVSSIPFKETEFTLRFRKGDGHFKPHEKSYMGYRKREEVLLSKKDLANSRAQKKEQAEARVLIIEDNKDIREYLEDLLSENYITETAKDGMDGYTKAINTIPDIIISDVMMPELDGFELCRKLKEKEKTMLVPIILLTAKPVEYYKTFGIRAGADDYLSKPFDPELLLEKISSILKSRKILKDHYASVVKVSGTEIEITPSEEKLIKQIIEIIEENISSEELDAGFIANNLNMSRSSLYRKMKKVSGYSINQFIRKIRLERAVQLLEDKSKTISEVAFDVGFNDQKYFREIFSQQFGASPSEYRKKQL